MSKVKAALAKSRAKRAAPPAPAKKAAPVPPPRAPKIPGDDKVTVGPYKAWREDEKPKRGRPPAGAGASEHPEAVKARARRAAARQQRGRVLTPETLRAAESAPRETPALTGDITTPGVSVMVAPEARAAAVKSLAGLTKVAGMIAAALFGDIRMRFNDEDALGTAELALDAYPELAIDFDMSKALFWSAVGSMGYERINYIRESRKKSPPSVAPVEVPEPVRPVKTSAAPHDGQGWSA